MTETNIIPHKITKPIQLLAAWFTGLAIINGSFLSAAVYIKEPVWIPALLCIASVVNVPLFIFSLFLLQTKYRPEMQEDTYYSKYLEKKYSSSSTTIKNIDVEGKIEKLSQEILTKFSLDHTENEEEVKTILRDTEVSYLAERFTESRSLSEIYLYPTLWKEIVDEWGKNTFFREDIDSLVRTGLILLENSDIYKPKLTHIGKQVVQKLESQHKLWNQNMPRFLNAELRSKK